MNTSRASALLTTTAIPLKISPHSTRSLRRVLLVGVLSWTLGIPPTALCAQSLGPALPRDGLADPIDAPPELRLSRELALAGIGSGLLVAGHLVPVHQFPVPIAGLDPATIAWGPDQGVVGRFSVQADRASNWTRNAALAFPFLLAVGMGSSDARWQGFGARSAVYAETLLVSQGSTLLAKTLSDRARPYAYLAESERPSAASYDVATARTFRSMPSGHSSSAWTGVSMGLTDHLLSRPRASAWERSALGFVGGGLAAATSSLRVEAGQHFPSDVLVGAAVGVATGIAIPLIHRDKRPLPSRAALFESIGGVVAGALAGVLATR